MANETPENETEETAEAAEGAEYTPDTLEAGGASGNGDVDLDLVLDIPVNVALRVGSTELSIRDLVRLVEGSVVALDREAETPMDVLVNGTLIAHGEIVVVDDRYGVRLTDVVSAAERIETLN